MKRPISPCNPGGKHDCEQRKVGCRSTCEKWQEYEAAKADFRNEFEKAGNLDTGCYVADTLNRVYFKSYWKHKKEGR